MKRDRRVPGMRIVGGADSPDVARDVIEATDEEIASSGGGGVGGWFWRRFFWLLTLAVYIAAALAVVAVFWVLYLAARALWGWMGLG